MEPSSDNRETTFVGPGAGRTRRRFFGVLGVCVAVILAVGGCTDTAAEEDPSDLLTATAPEEAETTPVEPTPADEARAALEAYLEFRDEAYRRAEYDLDELAELATGAEFVRFQQFLARSVIEPGLEYVGEYLHDIQEPSRSDDGFVMIDCEDNSGMGVFIDGTDIGSDPVDEEGNSLGEIVPIEYTVNLVDEQWLVADSNWLVENSPC